MYKNTEWRDRVIDANSGDLIQEGTDMSAANFNNMESGISDAHIAFALLNAMYRNELDRLKIAVVEGEVAAGASAVPYLPNGFTRDNCCVVSVMVLTESDTLLYDNAQEYLKVETSTASNNDQIIMIKNKNTSRAVRYKIALQKYE